MMASSSALAIGIERFMLGPSATSGRSHFALGSMPVSSKRGESNTRPFGAGDEAVDRLHIGLHRVLVEERRAVASAFDEIDARDLRIARQRIQVEHQRLLDEALDCQQGLGRADIVEAGAGYHS